MRLELSEENRRRKIAWTQRWKKKRKKINR